MTVGNCLMCGDKLKYYDSVRRIVRTKSRKSRYNIVKNYNSCTDGTQTIEQFSSHVMRHTGCTNMARAGVNVKATQYVMGHAHSDVTMDVYNHLNNKTDVKLEFSKFEKNGTKMVQ